MHELVGLSVILENYRDQSAKRAPQLVMSSSSSSKGSIMIKLPAVAPSSPGSARKESMCSSSSSAGGFLDHCFLCKQKLLPAKDIYMYKGDRAFCSVECRCRQMFMDEEEANTTTAKTGCTSREYNCSLAAMKPPPQLPTTTTTTTATTSSRSGKGPRNSFSTLATFCI